MDFAIITFIYLSKKLHHCYNIPSLCCLRPHLVFEGIEAIKSWQIFNAIFVNLEIHVFQILEFGKLLKGQNVKGIFQTCLEKADVKIQIASYSLKI